MEIIIKTLLPIVSDFGIEIIFAIVSILALIFSKSDKLKKLKETS